MRAAGAAFGAGCPSLVRGGGRVAAVAAIAVARAALAALFASSRRRCRPGRCAVSLAVQIQFRQGVQRGGVGVRPPGWRLWRRCRTARARGCSRFARQSRRSFATVTGARCAGVGVVSAVSAAVAWALTAAAQRFGSTALRSRLVRPSRWVARLVARSVGGGCRHRRRSRSPFAAFTVLAAARRLRPSPSGRSPRQRVLHAAAPSRLLSRLPLARSPSRRLPRCCGRRAGFRCGGASRRRQLGRHGHRAGVVPKPNRL